MDDPSGRAEIILLTIVALVAVQALFAAAEIAFVRTGRVGAKELSETKPRVGQLLWLLWKKPEVTLAAILVGITALNISANTLAESFASRWGAIGSLVAFFAMTAFIVIFGEIIPMFWASRRPRKVALLTSPLVFAFSRLLYPLVAALGALSRVLSGGKSEGTFSRERLEETLREAEAVGALSKERGRMIRAAVHLKHRSLKEIMVPRVDLIMLPEEATVEEAVRKAEETGKSRFPVYAGSRDEVTGMVHVKDLLALVAKGDFHRPLREVKREALFLPESMTLDRALTEMRLHRTRSALVVDEYGGVEGMVSLKDILEELVGEIAEEFEEVEEEMVRVDENRWEATGRTPLWELSQETGVEFSINGVETVAGLVLYELGRLPKPGDEVHTHGLLIRVDEVRGRRVEKVTVVREGP